jgi:hypothetical protein
MNNTVSHSRAGLAQEHTAHAHEHAEHTHEHAEHAVAETAPASTDNLILDIGADTGALIIHAAADRDETEIEISPADGGQTRSHNIVRRREAVSGAMYAAVFPALAAGDYVIWRNADTPAGTVSVGGGTVASFRLDQG